MELHARNQGFEWRDHDLDGERRLLSREQIEQFDRDGFVVLEDAFDAGTVARLIAEIDPFEAELEALLRDAGGKLFIARADEITFTVHLVTKSSWLRELTSTSPLVDLAYDLVGPDTRMYWDQSVYKKPDTEAPFPWHQDNGYTFVEPQAYLTCWIALTDTDETNGCPWVVPGIHRRGTLAHHLTDLGWVCFEEAREAVAVPVRAGSIVVFSSLTPHCTGANTTTATRKSWIVQYAPDGAVIHQTDGSLVAATAPQRQYRVLHGGSRPPSTA